MGGATLPTASTPGYTTFRGLVTCKCLAEWLPVYEALLLAKGLIKSNIDVWQLTGGAAASGGTHTQGGAFDLLYQTTADHVAVAREMGAPGTWGRKVSQGFTKDHLHGVLSGCSHNEPAAYQITAQSRGFNGLGVATSGQYAGMWGYGARDEFPNPSARRTWQEGIAWAKAEIARLTPVPPKETFLMALSDQQQLDLYNRVMGGIPDGKAAGRKQTTDGGPTRVLDSADGNYLVNILRSIASKLGVDVDEKAIASQVIAGLAPAVSDAVKSAVAAGTPTDQLADAVVAKLGQRLSPSA